MLRECIAAPQSRALLCLSPDGVFCIQKLFVFAGVYFRWGWAIGVFLGRRRGRQHFRD